jgi:hypothetical protein
LWIVAERGAIMRQMYQSPADFRADLGRPARKMLHAAFVNESRRRKTVPSGVKAHVFLFP